MKIEILPSLLAADFGRLGDEILRAEASGAEALHLDIMDAHFVPNLSFSPAVTEALHARKQANQNLLNEKSNVFTENSKLNNTLFVEAMYLLSTCPTNDVFNVFCRPEDREKNLDALRGRLLEHLLRLLVGKPRELRLVPVK